MNKSACKNFGKPFVIDKRVTLDELLSILITNSKRSAFSFESTEKLLHQVNYNELLVYGFLLHYFKQ